LKKLGFADLEIKLDLSKLILSGHSFGGITAIKVAQEDPRVKLLGTLDPWLFTYHREIGNGDFKINIPQIIVSTEMFHPFCDKYFPSWDSIKNLFKYAQDPRHENIVLKNTGHLHQCDLASLIPLELYLGAKHWPQRTTNETYMLNS
jgi:pimeloyl-ACP methyl ester carboxylesterase